jgi:hypothetical protein
MVRSKAVATLAAAVALVATGCGDSEPAAPAMLQVANPRVVTSRLAQSGSG